METRTTARYASLPFVLVAIFGIFLPTICQSVCPERCLCRFIQQPRTVICWKQNFTEFPENISDIVEQLNLSNNLLTHVSNDINRLIDLQYLNLARNMLGSLPADLSSLRNLRKLDLTGNKIHEIVDISSVKQLPSLRFLYLARNPLYNLEGLISSSLETLDASHCGIEELSNTSLDGLAALTKLSLAGNPLKFIQKAWSPKLQLLDMSDCLLNYLSPDTFSGFPELEDLRLSNNSKLVYCTRDSTLIHPKLKKLNVSRCNLDRPGLHGFPSLTEARLSRNVINFLPDRIFAKNRELGFLYLDGNDIEILNAGTFEGLVKLRVLDLSENNLRTIHPLSFHENIELKTLNLSYNIVFEFPNITSAVTLLDVSSNMMERINENFLTNMPQIRNIIMRDNRLQTIPKELKSTSLKFLDLRRNRLVGLNNNTFHYLPQLLRIDLSGNRLTEAINPAIFRNNLNLDIIQLEDNPWHCNCKELYALFNYLTEPPAKTYESSLLCQSPANVSGLTWENACYDAWNGPLYYSRDKTWGFIMVTILTIIVLFGSFVSIRHMMRAKRRAMEQRQQLESLRLLRQRRTQIMHEDERIERAERAPEPRIHPLELVEPPTYDEAMQMPRLARSLDNLDEISVDTSTARIAGSADNLRTRQKRTRRLKKRIQSEDDLLRREERRQERILRERNTSVGNIRSDLPQTSQRNLRSFTTNRARRHNVMSECIETGSGRIRTRPQTPSARKKRRRRTVYDGHTTDDEDSDFLRDSSNRSVVIRELRKEPRSGYRESSADVDS